MDFARILKEFQLIDWMKSRLVASSGEDDLILEIVVFVGTCAADEAAAMYICRSGVLPALIDLLKAKQEDDEIVLQVFVGCIFYEGASASALVCRRDVVVVLGKLFSRGAAYYLKSAANILAVLQLMFKKCCS